MFHDFTPLPPDEPVLRVARLRCARTAGERHAAVGRRLLGASLRRLFRHDAEPAARGAERHARVGDGGHECRQGIVRRLEPGARRDVLLAHRQQDDGGPDEDGAGVELHDVGRRAGAAGARWPSGVRPWRQRASTSAGRMSPAKRATRSSASSRAPRRGRRSRCRRPTPRPSRTPTAVSFRTRPTTIACARSRPAATPATPTRLP